MGADAAAPEYGNEEWALDSSEYQDLLWAAKYNLLWRRATRSVDAEIGLLIISHGMVFTGCGRDNEVWIWPTLHHHTGTMVRCLLVEGRVHLPRPVAEHAKHSVDVFVALKAEFKRDSKYDGAAAMFKMEWQSDWCGEFVGEPIHMFCFEEDGPKGVNVKRRQEAASMPEAVGLQLHMMRALYMC